MAIQQKLHKETVANHRDAWLAREFIGLRDLPRSGAPRKLSETHQQVLCAWATAEACTASELRDRLSDRRSDDRNSIPPSGWRANKRYRVSSSIFRGSKPGKYVPRNTKDFLLTAYASIVRLQAFELQVLLMQFVVPVKNRRCDSGHVFHLAVTSRSS